MGFLDKFKSKLEDATAKFTSTVQKQTEKLQKSVSGHTSNEASVNESSAKTQSTETASKEELEQAELHEKRLKGYADAIYLPAPNDCLFYYERDIQETEKEISKLGEKVKIKKRTVSPRIDKVMAQEKGMSEEEIKKELFHFITLDADTGEIIEDKYI